MANISNFTLPRTDWYDNKGRINKTALIENFNAIEAKLIELSSMDRFEATPIQFDELELDDVTLNSDSNLVVNLKSLIDILDFKYYPFNITFSGKKLMNLNYYNDDYELVTVTNKTVAANEGDKIYFDFDTGNISTSIGTDGYLLGVYTQGQIFALEGNNYIVEAND
jgi:hypothetical protein